MGAEGRAEGDLTRFVRRFKAGETIVSAGERAKQAFLLQQGRVRLLAQIGGEQRPGRLVTAGELFGEVALEAGQTYPHTARAVGDCSTLALTQATLEQVLRKNPKVAVQIVLQLGRRSHQAEQRLELLLLNNAPARVTTALVQAAKRQKEADGNATARFAISPLELSDRVDVPLPAVRRIVQKLSDDRLLSIDEEVFTVQDIHVLETLCTRLAQGEDLWG